MVTMSSRVGSRKKIKIRDKAIRSTTYFPIQSGVRKTEEAPQIKVKSRILLLLIQISHLALDKACWTNLVTQVPSLSGSFLRILKKQKKTKEMRPRG